MSGHPTFDDETLMRRVDGELSPEQAAAVDAAVAGDAALSARLAMLRRTRTVAVEAFPVAADARDADLARLIAAGAPARGRMFDGWGAGLREAFAPKRAALWGGLATACFAVGLVVGQFGERSPPSFTVATDGVIADAAMVQVLDRRLAADGADAEGRSIGLTFRDDQGRWCRTFQAGEAGVAGLACREGEEWRMQVLAPFHAGSSELRTAGSDTPVAVLSVVDALMADEALARADEARAVKTGWK